MGVQIRQFGPDDTVTLWDLLNELGDAIQEAADSGIDARYWSGYPSTKSLADGKNTSVKMSNQVESVGSIVPAWNGDTFRLPAGRYRIDVQLTFDADNTGYRVLSLLKNPGVTSYASTSTPPGTFLRAVQVESSSNNTSVQLTKLVTLSATDVLMIIGRQNSGSGLNVLGTSQDSELMIQRIGD